MSNEKKFKMGDRVKYVEVSDPHTGVVVAYSDNNNYVQVKRDDKNNDKIHDGIWQTSESCYRLINTDLVFNKEFVKEFFLGMHRDTKVICNACECNDVTGELFVKVDSGTGHLELYHEGQTVYELASMINGNVVFAENVLGHVEIYTGEKEVKEPVVKFEPFNTNIKVTNIFQYNVLFAIFNASGTSFKIIGDLIVNETDLGFIKKDDGIDMPEGTRFQDSWMNFVDSDPNQLYKRDGCVWDKEKMFKLVNAYNADKED